jgi:Gas vesicle protein K
MAGDGVHRRTTERDEGNIVTEKTKLDGFSVESAEVTKRAQEASGRIDCTPETIEQGLAKLVLSVIELLRQLLERQAIRRMEGGALSEQQVEEMGQALMTLEAKLRELAEHFGLTPADLNLDLGPLGNLLE